MRAFVTGLTGFVGPHLAEMLAGRGCEVVGLGLSANAASSQIQDSPHNVTTINADIRDYGSLKKILADFRPDHIYHLAAISNVVSSFKNPRQTYDVNVGGTLNLFEALRELNLRPRVLHVSTAHVYRSLQTDTGLNESAPVDLLTPYAASKFMCEALAAQYSTGFGLQVINVRPFNHVGPGQLTGFVCSDFARQIAAIKLGNCEAVLRVGNLTPIRDFTDVRDVVQAYWTVATLGTPGQTYNVSSGRPVSIQQIVTWLCELAEVEVRIEVDSEKYRPVETLRLYGDSSRLLALGWKPRIEFQQTLRDILQYWTDTLASGGASPVQTA